MIEISDEQRYRNVPWNSSGLIPCQEGIHQIKIGDTLSYAYWDARSHSWGAIGDTWVDAYKNKKTPPEGNYTFWRKA